MKNQFSYLLVLFMLSICIPNISAEEENYYKAFVTLTNLDEVLLEATDFYNYYNQGSGNGMPSADVAINEWTKDFLRNLLTQIPVDNEECRPGYPSSTFSLSSSGTPPTSALGFEWLYSNSNCLEYFGAFLDLRTEESGTVTELDPNIVLRVPGRRSKKAYALNARCAANQSGYFLIIIEKDITLITMPTGPLYVGPPETRLQAPNKDINLNVFPNPSTSRSFNLSFHLKKEDDISIQILNATTGRLVQQVLNKEHVKAGPFEKYVLLNSLSPDLYYVVLQTSENRIVQKLIIL